MFLYIFGQILPTFLIGIVVFIFIILMFQFLKLTEFILVHNVHIGSVLELLMNISIGFMPIILPMSLLFSVLLTYSRLSTDSEIVAFKALGYSPQYLAAPAIFFSVLICLISSQTLFELGPRARLKVDTLLGQIGNQKIISTIQEGTFSESFLILFSIRTRLEKRTRSCAIYLFTTNAMPTIPLPLLPRPVKSQRPPISQTSLPKLFSNKAISISSVKLRTQR